MIFLTKGFAVNSLAELKRERGIIEVRTTECETKRVRRILRDSQFLGSPRVGIGLRLAASALIVAMLWIGFFWATGG